MTKLSNSKKRRLINLNENVGPEMLRLQVLNLTQLLNEIELN